MVAESSLFWLPRSGNAPEEYEDASAADAAAGRFALADGASDTSFADLWARLLVEQFVAQAPLDLADWTDALPALQQRWRTAVDGLTMPYYAKAKFDRGAFATFLGVVLGEVAEGGVEWRAVAVGDTCLFHSRGNQLLRAFPLDESGKFNDRPPLVGSRASPKHDREKLSVYAHGQARIGDRLWLVTDALARWCLAEFEGGGDPWGQFESLRAAANPGGQFAAWLQRLRDARKLQDDDATLLAVVP